MKQMKQNTSDMKQMKQNTRRAHVTDRFIGT